VPDALTALRALRASVDRLSALVRPLGDELTRRAYPSAWTIADVMSHVGSSGVILEGRLDDALAGRETPDDFAEQVWAEWDAKGPAAKTADGLVVDDAFTTRLESVGMEERSRVSVSLGPLTLPFDQFVRLRLNEHLLHEWDVAVALDPGTTLAPDGVDVVIDNLELIGSYTSVPVAPDRRFTIVTAAPERSFTVTVETNAVEFSSGAAGAEPTLRMPAEAFIRLVYGRLDPGHTPSSVEGDTDALDQLRQVFPGP
jgi:uncharacterized protein (TIGR03083 family)